MNKVPHIQYSADDEFGISDIDPLSPLNGSINVFSTWSSKVAFSLPPADKCSTACIPPIHKLPLDIIIEIFKLLPDSDLLHNVPAVCQLWYNVSLSPILRTRLVVRRQIPAELLIKALSSRPMLRVLRCLALKNSESVLPDAIKFCPFLTCLNIGFITLSEQGATTLVNNLPPTLLHLNVEGINNIEIDFITTLVHRCPKLEALNLSHCVSVCDTCVKIISDGLHSLRRLNLDGVLWITDSGVLHLAGSKAVHNGSLKSIWLDGFELSNSGLNEFIIRLDYATKQISSDVADIMYSETGHMFGVQQLWISFCDHIEDEAIKSISNLSTLVALTLRKTHQVTSVGLSSLFITSLNHQLNLRYLEHLDLSEAPGLNDSVVMDICNCCGNRLRFLTLNWCWEVTDIGVNQIIKVCNSLHQLSLIGNSTIQGRAFSEIPSKVPHLIILNLTQCNHIVDNVLEDLAVKMPNLYVFDFFGERVGGGLDDICHFDVSRALGKVPICTD
ncbi:hypothetical protein MN116_005262 [Schistosoma mekongi]|uniref:F-box domain-containing protein n=1 Tax=Schistosoma mekongi TaxID=38744 RepID=A0AAE1ZEA3_SCHME|nr:hypothetical protein MN116_005262 [Schistosoma mekongi]